MTFCGGAPQDGPDLPQPEINKLVFAKPAGGGRGAGFNVRGSPPLTLQSRKFQEKFGIGLCFFLLIFAEFLKTNKQKLAMP